MTEHKNRRVVLVSFDGLRTDLIRPNLTPNLVRLQKLGVTFERHRTVYPSETRAAMPSLVTGAWPSDHGMVGNAYVDRSIDPPRLFDTSDDQIVEALDHASGKSLMGAVSLGEVLAAHGRQMVVLASNSVGTTRLFHHKVRSLGHLSIHGHVATASTSPSLLAELESRFGPLPPAPPPGVPDLLSQTFLTSALLENVWPNQQPDLAILGFGEPDCSSHYCGTGHQLTLQALRHIDGEFGRVLDWYEAEGRAQGVHLMAVSDHGHISVMQRSVLHEVLRGAGFRPGSQLTSEVDALVVPGQVGAIYLTDPTASNMSRLAGALMETDWCGPTFTRGTDGTMGSVPGTFARALVNMEHPRAADVLFSYRADDQVDMFGLTGRAWSSDWAIGSGIHGGLHPKEMEAVCIVAGEQFKSDERSSAPSGICDVAPTVLDILGLSRPATMTGRVLREAYATPGMSVPLRMSEQVFETGRGSYRQFLRRTWADDKTYVDAGWVA